MLYFMKNGNKIIIKFCGGGRWGWGGVGVRLMMYAPQWVDGGARIGEKAP